MHVIINGVKSVPDSQGKEFFEVTYTVVYSECKVKDTLFTSNLTDHNGILRAILKHAADVRANTLLEQERKKTLERTLNQLLAIRQ